MSLKVWFYSREGRDDDPLPEGEGISFLSSGMKLQGVGFVEIRKFTTIRQKILRQISLSFVIFSLV